MSAFAPELVHTTEMLVQSLRGRGLTITIAESCTGGLISALLTEISGSSDVFGVGYVVYANEAKTACIGVKASLIKSRGAVSEEVAVAMAEGAQKTSGAALAIAVTGIAGPTGATKDKPVGLIHLACARTGFKTLHAKRHFSGDRASVRMQAVAAALELVQRQLNQ